MHDTLQEFVIKVRKLALFIDINPHINPPLHIRYACICVDLNFRTAMMFVYMGTLRNYFGELSELHLDICEAFFFFFCSIINTCHLGLVTLRAFSTNLLSH